MARIDVDRRPSGTVERLYELLPITSDLPDEPRTAAVIKSFDDRLGKEFDAGVGTTRAPLDAETVRLRVAETNIGNLFADIIRAEAVADLAIFPSGSIRGDRVYPAGPLDHDLQIKHSPQRTQRILWLVFFVSFVSFVVS